MASLHSLATQGATRTGTRCGPRGVAFRVSSLPPPALSGSAASNPRSTYNPLALAYLGDAVWEAHTRRLEVEADTRRHHSKARGSHLDNGGAGVSQHGSGRGRTAASARGRGGGRQKAAGGRGDAGRGGGLAVVAGRAPGAGSDAGAGDEAFPSREERKQWATATFQALVFDALAAGGLPLAQSGASPPTPSSAAPSPGDPAARAPPPCGSSEPGPNTVSGASPDAVPKEPPAAAAAAAALLAGPGHSALSGSSPGVGPEELPQSPPAAAPPPPVFSLSPAEQDVLRWGRNASVSSVPRNVPVLTYKKATAVEVLVAHLYLTAPERCAQLVEAAVTSPLVRAQAAIAAAESGGTTENAGN